MEQSLKVKICEHSKNFTITELDFTQTLDCECEEVCETPEFICLQCDQPQLICNQEGILVHRNSCPSFENHTLYFEIQSSEVWCSQCMMHVAFSGEKIANLVIKENLTYETVVRGLREKTYKKVVVLTGAGISVSAGIPDFRTPGSGVYANLQKYDLERPEDLFTLSFFLEKPEFFYEFSKEFDLDKYEPTPAHYFIRLLQDQGLLEMNLTQNIDNLEVKAGIHEDKLIQAHGSLKGAVACAMCRKHMDPDVYKQHVMEGKVYWCTSCQSPVKPDVVFFGEDLPQSFSRSYSVVEDCDLMIIMGTALAVAPFKHLVAWASQAHQVLINRENTDKHGYDFEKGGNRLFLQGNCDDVIERLVRDIGLEEQFQALLPKREEEVKQ